MHQNKRFALYLPSYNAASTLPGVLDRIPVELKHKATVILVVDNYSTDDTQETVAAYKKQQGLQNLEVIRTPYNMGYGGSQKTAYQYCVEHEIDVVCMLHADGQYAPEMLPDILKPVLEDQADMVFGSRIKGNPLKGGMPLHRYLGNKALTFLQNTVLRSRLSEYHSGYRCFSVKSLSRMGFEKLSNDYHFDTEILILYIHYKMRIQEVTIPTHYGEEECYVNIWKYGVDVLVTTFTYFFHRCRVRVSENWSLILKETEKKRAVLGAHVASYAHETVLEEKKDALRATVLQKVRHYHRAVETETPSKIVPGSTYIPVTGKVMDADDMVSLVDASLDMWLTGGRFTQQFERSLAEQIKASWLRMTVSGSAANLLAFSALTSFKLGTERLVAGDEVITVAAGFPTTVAPVVQNNCVPVFVDVDPLTHNIDTQLLEQALSPRTRAIMLAHTLGNPFDIAEVMSFAEKHRLHVIEDCCDALGAQFDGQPVGTFGALGTLSFYPAHQITTGEGGAVFGKNRKYMKIVESFRDWGRDCWCDPGKDNTCGKRFDWQLGELPHGYDHKYIYSHLGYNLKATDMQAAVGLSQSRKLGGFVAKRAQNHAFLKQEMQRLGLDEYFVLPEATPRSTPSWFGFMLTIRKDVPLQRRAVVTALEKNHIGTRLLFAGNLTKQPAFKDVVFRVATPLVNTDHVMHNGFWVGVWPGLDEGHMGYIAQTLHSIVKEQLA